VTPAINDTFLPSVPASNTAQVPNLSLSWSTKSLNDLASLLPSTTRIKNLTPSTSIASSNHSCTANFASLRCSSSTVFSVCLVLASSPSSLSGKLAGADFSLAAAWASVCSCVKNQSRAPCPVTASILRTPEAMPASEVILKTPMHPLIKRARYHRTFLQIGPLRPSLWPAPCCTHR